MSVIGRIQFLSNILSTINDEINNNGYKIKGYDKLVRNDNPHSNLKYAKKLHDLYKVVASYIAKI